jgi:hypothetical protein
MTTSGTVGATRISIQQIIDSGARRAGKLAEELTSEQVLAAKQSLYLLLSSLSNWGINYWAIQKHIVGLNPHKSEYLLPIGTVDVLNANLRTVTQVNTGYYSTSGDASFAFDGVGTGICQLSEDRGSIGISAGGSVTISTVGFLPATSGSIVVDIECSQNGIGWQSIKSSSDDWVSGEWQYIDLPNTKSVPFWRISQTSGDPMAVHQVVFGTNPLSVPMARMNRDDYSSLPNRSFESARPLQYWFNRTIPKPTMNLWATPDSIAPHLELWLNRYVQDVGDLSGDLEIPQYMLLAIQWGVAHQMASELPSVEVDRIAYCEAQYEKHLRMAQDENRDKSPIYWTPNISAYTR